MTISESQEIYQAYLEGVRANPLDEELVEDLEKAWTERDKVFYTTKLQAQADAHAARVKSILQTGAP